MWEYDKVPCLEERAHGMSTEEREEWCSYLEPDPDPIPFKENALYVVLHFLSNSFAIWLLFSGSGIIVFVINRWIIKGFKNNYYD